MKVLTFLHQRLSLSIPLFLIVGFVTGLSINTEPLHFLIAPLTLLMIYPMMVGIKANALLEKANSQVQYWALLINFIIIPLFAYLLGHLFFFNHPQLALGLLLAALLPTSGMTISWTGFAKGNLLAAIKITIIGLFLGSLLTPFYIKVLLGAEIPIQLLIVFKQIFIFIAIPLIAGQITRYFLVKKHGENTFKSIIAPSFPKLSTIGVLGIVFVAMALKAKDLTQDPQILLIILVPLVILYLFNYLFSTWIAKRFLSYEDGIALIFGTVMRNLSIALALAMTAFGEKGSEAAILIALAYIIQVQSAALYVKQSARIFKKDETL